MQLLTAEELATKPLASHSPNVEFASSDEGRGGDDLSRKSCVEMRKEAGKESGGFFLAIFRPD